MESGFIVVNRQLQTSCQISEQSQGQQRGRPTRYCETSGTSSEEEKLPLCWLVLGGDTHDSWRRKLAGKPSSPSPEDQPDSLYVKELEKLAGKPDSPSPEDQQDSLCVKELENTSLVCGSDRDLESVDNPTPAPAVDKVWRLKPSPQGWQNAGK